MELNFRTALPAFAKKLRGLIDFDDLAITSATSEAGSITFFNTGNIRIPEWEKKGPPYEGSIEETMDRVGKPHIANFPDEKTVLRDYPGEIGGFRAGHRAIAGAPIMWEGQRIGYLLLISLRPGVFTKTTLVVLDGLSQRIAPAVNNALEHEELVKTVELLKQAAAIDELGETLANSLDIQEQYAEFAKQVQVLIPHTDDVSITHASPNSQKVRFFTTGNLQVPEWETQGAPYEGSIEQTIDGMGKPYIANLPDEETVLQEHPSEIAGFHAGYRAIAGTPLRWEGRHIGNLLVVSTKEGVFDDRTLSLLSSIALRIAPAVNNAFLYEKLTRTTEALGLLESRNTKLEALRETAVAIGHHIRNSLTPMMVLGETVDIRDKTKVNELVDAVRQGSADIADVIAKLEMLVISKEYNTVDAAGPGSPKMLDLGEELQNKRRKRPAG